MGFWVLEKGLLVFKRALTPFRGGAILGIGVSVVLTRCFRRVLTWVYRVAIYRH